jgi:hypothetical protein
VELGRATGNAIKILNGQFQRAVLVGMAAQQRGEPADWENRLHGSFPERVLVAHNNRAHNPGGSRKISLADAAFARLVKTTSGPE